MPFHFGAEPAGCSVNRRRHLTNEFGRFFPGRRFLIISLFRDRIMAEQRRAVLLRDSNRIDEFTSNIHPVKFLGA
jgi:hypothetical protein